MYARYNHRRYVPPDPLEALYAYGDPADQEIAGLVAALLAYGRVGQIVRSVRWVLGRLGEHPRRRLHDAGDDGLAAAFEGFRHRFQTGSEIAGLLAAAREVIGEWGSLRACFASGLRAGDATVLPALGVLVGRLGAASPVALGHLLPDPAKSSACKRLHLFCRWMVRRDAVDPGTWEGIDPRLLIVPLDTHMHRWGRRLGLTTRRQADLRAALEATAGFRKIAPDDPVRYDFALTRLGIRPAVERPARPGRFPDGWSTDA